MKFYRLAALTTAGVLCFGLLAGCGTSHMSESELESVDSSWQQLSTPTSTPTPKAETVMPELEQKDKQDGGTDVTKGYKNSFVGTWDDADGFDIYEFKSNENLVITTGKEVANYTYWLEDNGKQVLLYIFENGQEEAETYSFTLSGSNLTLYDTVSGNAVKQLVKRVNIAAPTATPKPTAAPATQAPAPTASPTQVPSPSPSVAPSPSHSPTPSMEPSPSPSPAPDPELPETLKKALPAVECALDVVMDGTGFDGADGKAFWNVMARYLSRTNGSGEDGTFTVTKDQVLTAAKSVFSGLTELPDVPENSGVVTLVPSEEDGSEDQYQLLWGATGGHDLEVLDYDGVSEMEVQVDGSKTYQITLDDSGAIVSVKEA